MTEALPRLLKLYSVFFRDSQKAKSTAGSEPTRRWASKECGFHGTESDGLGRVIYVYRNLGSRMIPTSTCLFDEREAANSATLIL